MLVKVQARLCLGLHTFQGCSVNQIPLRQLRKSHITKSQTHHYFFSFLQHNPTLAKEDIVTYYYMLHIVHIFNVPFFYARLAKLSPGCMQHVVAQYIAATIIILFEALFSFTFCFLKGKLCDLV